MWLALLALAQPSAWAIQENGGTAISSPAGSPFTQSFNVGPPKTSLQVWALAQDTRGLVYAGTYLGVSVFDGSTWRHHDIPGGGALALCIGENGRLYVGGQGNFGYLERRWPDSVDYRSLTEFLPEEDREFGKIWQVVCHDDKVYFRTHRRLFVWTEPDRLAVIDTPTRFQAMFSLGGELYLQIKEAGLTRMEAGGFEPVSGGEIAAKTSFFFLEKIDGQLLGFKATEGAFIRTAEGTFRPFPTQADAYLKENRVYGGVRLQNGHLAIGTLFGGLVVLDAEGRLVRMLHEGSGLKDPMVLALMEDREGGLWLGHNLGLVRAEVAAPLTRFDDSSGLKGTVYAMRHHRGALYAASSNGIYVLEPENNGLGNPGFRRIEGSRNQCWSMAVTGNRLWVGCTTGLFLLEDGETHLRDENLTVHSIAVSRKMPGRVFLGGSDILVIYEERNGRWMRSDMVTGLHGDIREILETPEGDFLLATPFHGIYRVRSTGPGQWRVDHFSREALALQSPVFPFLIDGEIFCGTEYGLFRLNPEVLDTATGEIPALSPAPGFTQAVGKSPAFYLDTDAAGNLLLSVDRGAALASRNGSGSYILDTAPFARAPAFEAFSGNAAEDGTLWVGGPYGLLRYDPNLSRPEPPLAVLLRGTAGRSGEAGADIALADAADHARKLPPAATSLRFEFALPSFDEPGANRFRFKLEGFEPNWSSWQKTTFKEYTNLAPGAYRFAVQGQNVHGRHSGIEILAFEVLPPWYRAWWAYLVYTTAGLALLALSSRWRTARLHAKNRRMAEQIDRQTAVLANRNKQLADQNRLLEAGRRKIEDQSRKLAQSVELQSRFFTNISHELRTPLTLTIGPLEDLLAETEDPPKGWRNALKTMLRHSRRLLVLVNQLLAVSKLEAGHMRLLARPGDIVDFAKQRLSAFRSLADSKGVHLRLEHDPPEIKLYFDPEKMASILDNLLANALKATSGGDRVAVEVRRASRKNEVVIRVRDSGPGLPPAERDKIFERFHQAARQDGITGTGSGIGLALVKELTQLHGGQVRLADRRDRGCCFELRFPAGREHLKPDQVGAPVPAAGPLASDELLDFAERERDRSGFPLTVYGRRGKGTVLVVEDQPDLARYLGGHLGTAFQVITVSNGSEGLAVAREQVPDLVISDIMMPGMDGYRLCNELKGDLRTSHIPVILLTAKAGIDATLAGLEQGADDYMVKPFNGKELLLRVNNQIATRQRWREKLGAGFLGESQPEDLPSMDQLFLDKAVRAVHEHIGDAAFGVAQWAESVGLSNRQLQRKLGALTGLAPLALIRRLRLERAAGLLQNRTGTVAEIAYACGFESPAYFTKQFRKRFGVPPSNYRKQEMAAE